jgi:hypothetical protein
MIPLLASLILAQAQPQGMCGPLNGILAGILQQFGESKLFEGTDIAGRRVVITQSYEGNWTMIVVEGDTACIRSGGTKSELDKGT